MLNETCKGDITDSNVVLLPFYVPFSNNTIPLKKVKENQVLPFPTPPEDEYISRPFMENDLS